MCYFIARAVPRLQDVARHTILRCLGRYRYSLIPTLPLPKHLINYTSHNRTWEHPVDTPTTLCPIEHSSSDEEGEGLSIKSSLPGVLISNHGERTMFFNVDGVFFEVRTCDQSAPWSTTDCRYHWTKQWSTMGAGTVMTVIENNHK